ncbi:MAG TPA: hypothetical protein VGB54_11140 [Allosphingosinicella sp.]|jgi:hypothetical protein
MAGDSFTYGVRGPDGDNLVWLIYDTAGRSGVVRIGTPGDRDADRAIAIRNDPERLGREFGHLVEAR